MPINIIELLRTNLEMEYCMLEEETMATMPELEYEWMSVGLLSRDGINLLTGHPGAGKSWLRMDIEYRLAAGLPIMDHATPQPLRVLSIDAESGIRRTKIRMDKLRAGYKATGVEMPTDLPICRYFPDEVAGVGRLDLLNNRKHVEQVIRMALACRADVIVLDALYKLQGGDLASATDMSELSANLNEIRHETGTGIILVHHLRKGDNTDDPKQAAAGSFVLPAEMATHLSIRKYDSTGNLQIIKAKSRDSEEEKAWNVRLENVGSGVVVVPATYTPKAKPSKADEVKPVILAALTNGAKTQSELITHCESQISIGEKNVRNALAGLVEAGTIVKSGGQGKTVSFELPHFGTSATTN